MQTLFSFSDRLLFHSAKSMLGNLSAFRIRPMVPYFAWWEDPQRYKKVLLSTHLERLRRLQKSLYFQEMIKAPIALTPLTLADGHRRKADLRKGIHHLVYFPVLERFLCQPQRPFFRDQVYQIEHPTSHPQVTDLCSHPLCRKALFIGISKGNNPSKYT